MPVVNLPYDIQNGQPLDASKVMANLQALAAVVNGSLDGDNILTGTPVEQTGQGPAIEGVASTLLRSDAKFVIRGVEQLAALPTTDNFYSRMFTLSGDHKLYYCTDPSGAGTFIVIANQAAVDLPVHAAEHVTGGHDPLPNNFLATAMRDDQAFVHGNIGADVAGISTSSFTLIKDLVVTTTGIQTILVSVQVKATNTHATNKPSVGFRVLDVTAGSITIWRSLTHQLGASGSGSDAASLGWTFPYTVPAGGARTLRLQAGCDIASVDIKTQTGAFNGDSTNPDVLSAVIV